MAQQRLAATLGHLHGPPPSFIAGPTEPSLRDTHLGQLLDDQANKYGAKEAIICSSTRQRLTYKDLSLESRRAARGLLALGIQHGDVIGILAGNRKEYVELFFAAGRIGAILAVFNNTYTSNELEHALIHTGCKILFTAPRLGNVDNKCTLSKLTNNLEGLPDLQHIILLDPESIFPELGTFDAFLISGEKVAVGELSNAERAVSVHDVCNLQFTSGTTGNPKAAMLTHFNVINNAVFIGDRMHLTDSDVLCCPPPLFHCFGLVLGLLAAVTHGCAIVFPSESFDASATIQAVIEEGCTALHGVPAMWAAEMEMIRPDHDFSRLRTGIAAGSATPRQMMEDLQQRLNLTQLTNTYGMTETSPASFMTSSNDTLEKRLATVGRILPHTSAKIIDTNGSIVPLGSRGQLCVAGYLLQKGYWKNPEKTKEVMIRDKDGVLWMHTGDEASFDAEGFCRITGRIKDIIIRGGENIFPLEIENRLIQHPDIINASVVGVPDQKYGETVGAFVQTKSKRILSPEVLRAWVREKLARHKAPRHVFHLGEDGVGDEFPLTGSGKVKKNVLRDLAERLVSNRSAS